MTLARAREAEPPGAFGPLPPLPRVARKSARVARETCRVRPASASERAHGEAPAWS
jgi:hypothetical protein